jgi:hypothetical protein
MNPAANLDFWLKVKTQFEKSGAGMFCLTSPEFKSEWNNNFDFRDECFSLVDLWRKEVWNLDPQEKKMGQLLMIKTSDFEKMGLPISRDNYAIYLRLNFLEWVIKRLQ